MSFIIVELVTRRVTDAALTIYHVFRKSYVKILQPDIVLEKRI